MLHLQNYKMINVCCFKPLNLWLFFFCSKKKLTHSPTFSCSYNGLFLGVETIRSPRARPLPGSSVSPQSLIHCSAHTWPSGPRDQILTSTDMSINRSQGCQSTNESHYVPISSASQGDFTGISKYWWNREKIDIEKFSFQGSVHPFCPCIGI